MGIERQAGHVKLHALNGGRIGLGDVERALPVGDVRRSQSLAAAHATHGGDAYEFNVHHLVTVNDPLELFPVEMVEV